MSDEKKNRRFRTLDELQEEYNETDHNFKDELIDIGRNLKKEIFSPWGALITLAMISALLSAIVR